MAELVKTYPDVPNYRINLAAALQHLGSFRVEHGELQEARQLREQQVAHMWVAFKYDPRAFYYRLQLADTHWQLARVLSELGDHAAMAEIVAEVPRLYPSRGPYYLNAARFLARCVALAEKDGKLTPEQQKQLVQQYGDQAMRMLRETFKRPYKDGDKLKSNAVLKPLWPRDDFQQLLKELEVKPESPER
jgi:hypothetical protein